MANIRIIRLNDLHVPCSESERGGFTHVGGAARDALLPVACDESDGAEDGDKNLVCEL